MKTSRLYLIPILLLASGCEAPAAQSATDTNRPQVDDRVLFERMLVAEDTRATTDEQRAPLREGLRHADPFLRRIAVRALGRFERAEHIRDILPLLEDADAAVRAEAANALGQAARGGDTGLARNGLHARLANETNPQVRGVLAETLGRLPHGSAAEVEATATTISGIATNGGPESILAHLGAARGFFFLVRQQTGRESLPASALAALRSLITYGTSVESGDVEAARRVRTVAAAALFTTGRAITQDYDLVLRDADPFVRREAAAALTGLQDSSRIAHLNRSLADPSPVVRYDALRVHARANPAPCTAIVAALADDGPHVRLLAIDASSACANQGAIPVLDSLARALSPANTGWHDAAHALASLAIVAPERARTLLPDFVAHDNFFVRAWAAVAATRLQDEQTLRALAGENQHPNVRTAAITGLAEIRGHAADSIYIAQLESDDSQLAQTAAGALAGTTNAGAIDALLQSLERFSDRARETERDARMALLERIEELGSRDNAASLEPRLADYDPVVAARVAEILGAWTGSAVMPAPMPPEPQTPPTLPELERLAASHVVITLETGDTIEIALRPFDAPTNTARFARLASDGYFDGLTFHRVAPNFVIQGGSPNANEYAGDAPFSRDELVIDANWRGTVGLSTRGRDTGDAQIFVNLIDNVRLDHDYTVFGDVVRGMDVVDRVLEGAVMRSVTVR